VLVGWGWNLWDWNWFRRKTGESIAPRLAGGASDGDIIVVHDGHHKNPRADRRYALDVTERLVPLMRGRGFTFRTVCEAIESGDRRSAEPIRPSE
jgi:peptidoglycan/xylan/chitin deacetylase (PgdA/CDA1 family)